MNGQDNICNAWAALKLVRMAIEQTCPAGVLPSEEAVLLLYGPEPIHEGEALAKAIIETVERLTRCLALIRCRPASGESLTLSTPRNGKVGWNLAV
ncbi:PAC2 family protein [Mesorhizobium sp. WSM2561]|nr:PAC2 family protein [Mesorhizobium sp. WSM2561]